jgi:integrase
MAAVKSTVAASLSPKLIESLQAERPPAWWSATHPDWKGGDYELGDPEGTYKALRLRVTAKGEKVFRWYVNGARPRRVITIGRWSMVKEPGYVTLADAHGLFNRLKEAHKAGNLDVVEGEIRAMRTPPKTATAATVAHPAGGGVLTLNDVAEDFFKFIERRRKHPGEVRRSLEKDVLPILGMRPVDAITPREIRAVVERVIEERGSRAQAGKVLAQVKQLYRFACGRDEVKVASNPAYPLEADALGVENNERQRVLFDEEIPAFWNALGKSRMTGAVRAALRVILLTGVRSCELLRAKWSDINRDEDEKKWEKGQTEPRPRWTIPVENQKLTKKQEKRAKPWVVPLTPAALALFDQLKVLAEGSEWVMASPFAEEGRISEKALNAAMRKLFEGEEPLLKFTGDRPTPHDLRRTVRTNLARLGIPKDVSERCLNHRLPNMEEVYNRHDYVPERRAALEKWTAFVERLIEPGKSSVAFMATKWA